MKYITALLLLLYLAVLQGCIVNFDGQKSPNPQDNETNKGALEVSSTNRNFKPQVTVKFLYSTDGGYNFHELQEKDGLRTGDKFQIEYTALDKCFIFVRHQFHGGEEFLEKGIEVKEKDKGVTKILPAETQTKTQIYGVEERNTLGLETLIFSASFEPEKGTVEDSPNDPGTFVASVTFKHIPY